MLLYHDLRSTVFLIFYDESTDEKKRPDLRSVFLDQQL